MTKPRPISYIIRKKWAPVEPLPCGWDPRRSNRRGGLLNAAEVSGVSAPNGQTPPRCSLKARRMAVQRHLPAETLSNRD